jgi:hypothetical protein
VCVTCTVCLSAACRLSGRNFETYESLTIAIHIIYFLCFKHHRSTFGLSHTSYCTSTMAPIPAPNEKKDASSERKSQKQKRKSGGKHEQTNSLEKGDSGGSKRKRGNPLNGMTLSVSTLEEKGPSGSEAGVSFKEVSQMCRDLGADVSNQICKRVQVLICTRSAVEHATQRVRKAFKKSIPLVDSAWLKKCQLEKARVDFEPYLLEKEATESIDNYKKALEKSDVKKRSRSTDDIDKEENEELPDRGWSEPASLGCCCVCHEQGTADDCEWCVDCKA